MVGERGKGRKEGKNEIREGSTVFQKITHTHTYIYKYKYHAETATGKNIGTHYCRSQ